MGLGFYISVLNPGPPALDAIRLSRMW